MTTLAITPDVLNAFVSRHEKGIARGYRFLLVFVREWTHGTCLAGQSMVDSLPFCDRRSAEEWVASINKQHERSFAAAQGGKAYRPGQMTYRVTDAVVVDTNGAVS